MKRFLLALTVCASLATTAEAGTQTGELSVWIGSDKAYKGLQEIGQRFQNDTGIKLTVDHAEHISADFSDAALRGEGPDIIIWPHDMFAGWVESGLLAPVVPSDKIRQELADFTWHAVTVDGQVYGYPITVEAVSLLYNKDLLPEPPTTWEEIPELDKQLQRENKHAILWDYNDTYYSWGLLSANGGYAFAQHNGTYDLTDTGVNNSGAQAGAKMLKHLIDTNHLPSSVTYQQMAQAFLQGDVAMIIDGPWSWSNYKSLNFGVTRLPSLNGQPAHPFVGVMAAGINANSSNWSQAVNFIENYLLTIAGLTDLNYDKMLGAVTHLEFQSVIEHDPRIRATMLNATQGDLMPPVSNMPEFWDIMKHALQAITSGDLPVKTALDKAAARLISTAG